MDRVSVRDPRPHPPAPARPDTHRWRVPAALPALKLVAAVPIAVLGVTLGGDRLALWVAAGAAALLTAWALRDLVAPVRVAADSAGITVVAGYAARRRLAWAQIEAVRVDTRPRLGIRTETLEIDTGETLYLYGTSDLGTTPTEVAAALEAMRPRG